MFIKRRHKKTSTYKTLVRRVIIDRIFDLKLDIYNNFLHLSTSGYRKVFKIPISDINVEEAIEYIKKINK